MPKNAVSMPEIYPNLRQRAQRLFSQHNLLGEPIRVRARALSAEEAIGNPEADDFPLQKGKERLMQAEFKNALGQAFTDHYGDFTGTLEEVMQLAPSNNYRRAVFVATLNAVMRHLNLIEGTVHCRDREPALCARQLADYLEERFGAVKIAQIGYQPRMIESISDRFPLRVIDLDSDNIGTTKGNVVIEGPDATDDAIRWADLRLVTGTALVNDTLGLFLEFEPVLFYGITIAGAAHLMGWERFCVHGK